MEPADIDWKNVISRYVRDEALENIDAPKWVDFTDLDASFSAVDDAWFCRPDCNHPNYDDFKVDIGPKGKLMRSSSEILPFGERNGNIRDATNLKRRGGIGALLPTSHFPSPNKSKKPNHDSENQDPTRSRKPNHDSENQDPNLPPLAAKKFKDQVKSSAEKPKRRQDEEREELLFEPERNQNHNKLRSTLSARNLFSGRDILGQISEFYGEIKRMAVNIGSSKNGLQMEGDEEGIKENMVPSESISESGKKKKLNNKMNLKIETENENLENKGIKTPSKKITRGILKEVRENPPTPQRFLSPSPLKKQPKSTPERRLLREIMEQKQNSDHQKLLRDDNCTGPSSSTSMFWFLKPCTYLVD